MYRQGDQRHGPVVSIGILILLLSWLPVQAQTPPGELFEIALKGVQEKGAGETLRVDPRPIRITPKFAYPTEADYYADTSGVTASRLASLSKLGIIPTEIAPVLKNCTGTITTPPYRDVSGCPDSSRLELAFDLPRRHVTSDAWALRGILLSYESYGRSARTFDVIFTRINGEWKVEIIDLVFID